MKKGFVELANARFVRDTDKAVLLDFVDANGAKKQSWFPKKAITEDVGGYGVAIWFQKIVSGNKTPTKTELVNKFEKKRLIQPEGDNVDCLVRAGENVIRCYAEYRKGSAGSGNNLTDAFNELSEWVEATKKDRAGKAEVKEVKETKETKSDEPKFFGNVDKVLEQIVN